MAVTVSTFLFKLLGRLERAAAYAQGKGYGATTVAREVTLLRKLLCMTPSLAVDVGGNVGNYTAELRRRNPALEIHTFEPSETNLTRLAERFRGDERITLVPLALSDRAGSATLYSNELGSGLASLTQRRLAHFDIAFNSKETIKTVRFEDYWREQLQSRPLDMVKIDIEGHELAALKGFGAALDLTRVVQFEFGGCNIDTRTYFQDFWYFFQDRGFDIYRVAPLGAQRISRYRESDEYFLTTNFIAVNGRQKTVPA